MALVIDGIAFDETITDPLTPSEGQLWYNTLEHSLKAFINGEKKVLATLPVEALAANVSADTTNFNGILSAADDNVQKCLETIDNVLFTGVLTPTYTKSTNLWYCTIAGWEALMVYDSTRTKWLSVAEWTLGFGHDLADGELLRGYGVNVPGIGTGVLIPHNACIKRITARTVTDASTKRLDLYVNGASVFNFNLVDGTNCSYYKNNSLNIDLNEDDNVWVYVDAADLGVNDIAVVLWCSWRVPAV